MKLILTFTMIIICFIMIFLKNPISMGLAILFQTLLICLISGMFSNTYWFSYILFLVFLGGLLVLFMYVSSIASNELFSINFNNKLIFIFIIWFSIILITMFKFNMKWMNSFINSQELSNFFNLLLFFNYENNMNLSKLYNTQTYFLMIMLILYLFITLVAVIKITNIFYGPLRSMNN